MPVGRPKGLPKTGGRQKGTPNKITAEKRATLAELAQQHTGTAISALVEVARTGSDAARVAAAVALLDRAYGKPVQMIEGPGPEGEHLHKVKADADDFASAIRRLAAGATGEDGDASA
jgi:hypothetical protein